VGNLPGPPRPAASERNGAHLPPSDEFLCSSFSSRPGVLPSEIFELDWISPSGGLPRFVPHFCPERARMLQAVSPSSPAGVRGESRRLRLKEWVLRSIRPVVRNPLAATLVRRREGRGMSEICPTEHWQPSPVNAFFPFFQPGGKILHLRSSSSHGGQPDTRCELIRPRPRSIALWTRVLIPLVFRPAPPKHPGTNNGLGHGRIRVSSMANKRSCPPFNTRASRQFHAAHGFGPLWELRIAIIRVPFFSQLQSRGKKYFLFCFFFSFPSFLAGAGRNFAVGTGLGRGGKGPPWRWTTPRPLFHPL